MHFLGHSGCAADVLSGNHAALGSFNCLGRHLGDLGGKLDGRLDDVAISHALHQAQACGFVRVDQSARHEKHKCFAAADQGGEALSATAGGKGADLDLGHAEASRAMGDADVTSQRQDHATTKGMSTNGCNDRKARRLNEVVHGVFGVLGGPEPVGTALEFQYVGADRKCLAAACQDHGTNLRVGVEFLENG